MTRKKILLAVAFLLLVGTIWWVRQDRAAPPDGAVQPNAPAGFDKSQHSLDEPGSLWWVVNKNRPLPEGYAPDDLVAPDIPIRPNASNDERRVSTKIVPDLETMVAAAKQSGISLLLASGYRSYSLQVSVYNQNVKQLGRTEADKVSAPPGTSEHQTGLSLDIGAGNRTCEIQECFATTPEGQWVAVHAHEHGFIIRYPAGKQAVTGYNYEPWHLRYVGPELAAELKRTGQTMEEFFSL